jgi:hypothetical protein
MMGYLFALACAQACFDLWCEHVSEYITATGQYGAMVVGPPRLA